MKKLFFILSLLTLAASSGHGSILVGHDGKLFEVPNDSAAFSKAEVSKRIQGDKFIALTKASQEGYVIHTLSMPISIHDVSLKNKPEKPPKLLPPEGCGQHLWRGFPNLNLSARFQKVNLMPFILKSLRVQKTNQNS